MEGFKLESMGLDTNKNTDTARKWDKTVLKNRTRIRQ